MPIVSSIKPQKKKSRFNIFLDGKFAFGIDEETLIGKKLKVGKNLSQKEVENIIKKSNFQKAYDKALHFLSFRPRSEKETKVFLVKKKLGKETIKLVIKKLKEQKLIDDKEFVSWWIKQRQTFRPKGMRLIKKELWQKGVTQELIDEIKEDNNQEFKLALKLAKKKASFYRKLLPSETFQKLTHFLQRRGFSWEVIREIIDELSNFE